MRRALLTAAFLAAALPCVASSQGTPQARINRARGYYESFQAERARDALLALLGDTLPMTRLQVAQAYKYLGGSLALLGQRDSAATMFRRALEHDPKLQLDSAMFSGVALDAFDAAAASRPGAGTIRLGSATRGSQLFLNGRPHGDLSRVRVVHVPPGTYDLSIRAIGCQSWDSTVTVPPYGHSVIGRRTLKCP